MKVIFLDRDGTINKEVNYLVKTEDIKILPKVVKALKIFKKLGFLNIIITNQSAIARGVLTISELEDIHNEFHKKLTYKDIKLIDEIYYSPFHIDGIIEEYKVESIYRKPFTGMILEAQNKYDIDMKNSYLIGDSVIDMECAQIAGLNKILLLTGYGREDLVKCSEKNIMLDYVAKDLLDAAKYIREKK